MPKLTITLNDPQPCRSAEWFNDLLADLEAGAICAVTVNREDLDWLNVLDTYGAFTGIDAEVEWPHARLAMAVEARDV